MKMKMLALVFSSLIAQSAFAAAEVNVYSNRQDELIKPIIQQFEKETGIKVSVTDYDSNDVALAKVEAGGHGFDLVVPSANYVPIWIEKGLITELDL